jgi:hypothetical protein
MKTLGLLALPLLVSLLPAQQRLIGFTVKSTPVESTTITRQTLCTTPNLVCADALPWPTVPYAGGAAYSPMKQSVWHSEGFRLQEIPLDGCKPTCSTAATRSLGTDSRVGGLTMDPLRNEMLQVESIAGTGAIVVYGMKDTCPTFLTACKFPLASPKHFAGAIAYDAKRRLVYVANSLFDVAAPENILYVFRRGDTNCAPLCKLEVKNCLTGGLQAIRAMAYDECTDTILLSDGRQTSEQRVVFTPSSPCPVLRPMSCCPLAHPAGELWAGFDLEPIHPRRLGAGCTQRSCAHCPNVSLVPNGDPTVGNSQFGFQVQDGPVGAISLVFLSPGPCTAGIPIGCGQFLPALPPILLPPFGLAGGGPCGGQGSVGLPIPNDYALCNVLLCAQGIILCPGAPIGIGLTNALVLVVDA